MKKKYSREILITPGLCDYSARLGVGYIFTLFMDIASEHAERLGMGKDAMLARDLFWITVKTKVHIIKRPPMMTETSLETWPAVPGRHLCNRYYVLRSGDEVLAEGRTEWAVMNIKKQSLENISALYPLDIVPEGESVCDEPVARLSRDITDCEKIGAYTVKSTDIDIGGHMNNVAYVFAVLSLFSVAEQKDMRITDMEVSFAAQCFEGDVLTAYKRITDKGTEVLLTREDGTVAFMALITGNR